MITEPSEADRERIRQAIWIKSIKTFNVEDGVGTLAQFDAVIPGILTLKKLRLVRGENGSTRVHPPRLSGDGARSVDIQTWLRSAICNAAIEAVYLPDAEIPPHVPGLDVASLPEQLMRAVVR